MNDDDYVTYPRITSIVDNTLYFCGVDSILRHCLTHEEVEVVLNDFHGGACGGNLSGISTA